MALLQLFHSIIIYGIGVQAARESLLAYLPDRKKGGPYAKYTPEQKALIVKRAAEHGVVDSYHRFYLKRIDLAFEIVLCADPLPTSADSLVFYLSLICTTGTSCSGCSAQSSCWKV